MRLIKLILLTIAMMILSSCHSLNDDSDGILKNTGYSTSDFDELGDAPLSDISSTAILGSWTTMDNPDVVTWLFKENGKGRYQWSAEDLDNEYLTRDDQNSWYLDGNELSVAFTGKKDEYGTICEYNEVWSLPAALINDRMYLDAMYRIKGGGDSLDGTWEKFEGYMESYKCDNTVEKISMFAMTKMIITGDTFTMTFEGGEYYLGEGGKYIEQRKGTIERDGDFVKLYALDDPNYSTDEIYRIAAIVGDGILNFINMNDYDTYEDALAAVTMIKQ